MMSMLDCSFNGLLNLRRGDSEMTSGGGSTHIVRASTTDEWEEKACALREIFRHTLGTPPDEPAIELNIEVVEDIEYDEYIERKLCYSTGKDERIFAYMLVPLSAAKPLPGVLCIHQTVDMGKEQVVGHDLGPEAQDMAVALHLVKRGFVTFSHDLIAAGERCYPGLKAFDTAPFYEQYPRWSVRGKDLHDISRAIDVMQQMPEIDSECIGSIGHSLGGGYTVYAMAVDSRIKAGVSNCGIWPLCLAKNPFGEARTEWWTGRPVLRPYCTAGKAFPIDIHEVMALAAPRALMNISALNDCQYSVEEGTLVKPNFENMANQIGEVYRLYGNEDGFVCKTHFQGHCFNDKWREDAYAFLGRQLFI